jgi:hypothetical protein
MFEMATIRQKEAARENLKKARKARSSRSASSKAPRRASGMSTAEQNRLSARDFAFSKERKEPLTDARHVRNAIARFDQVEGVTDAERDRAWKKIRAAAKKYDIEVSATDWRELTSKRTGRKRP